MNVGELKVQAIVETSAVKKGADNFVNDLNRMDNSTLKQLKNIGQLTAGYFAIGPALQQFTRESVNSFLESETASKTLSAALKGNQADIDRLTKQASDLQSKSIFSDEQIMNAQAMFGFMGKNADEIEQLIPLVINLGAAQERTGNGQANLVQISKMLARSTGEELSGSIERLIGPLSETEKQMLNNAQGMDRINLLSEIMTKRFGDIGFQLDDTASQWKNMNNQVDEFKEGFGKGLVESINTGLKALQRIQGENKKTQISFSDLGYAISKALIGPIMNVVDLLGWLESKYGEALNGIQQKIVSFVEFLQGNPVFKLIPGISDIDLDSFRTQRSESNNGIRGVTGDATGDRGKKFLSGDNKTVKDKSGSNKIADMTPEEQLNFLQKLRQEVAALTAEEKSLGEQLLEQNLLDYERLALLARLTEVQAKLNEIRGEGSLDVSGKVGELEALSEMLKGLEDDPRFIKAGKPFTGAKQEGPSEEPVGFDLNATMQVAQNIYDILNQPLDNPFKTMQAILQIAMQVGGLLQGGGGMGGGFLSFLGPIGMGVGLLGNIFGSIFGGSKKGRTGGSGNMQRMGAMFRTFAQTGFLAELPPQVLAGGYSSGSINMGNDLYINGRKVDGKFKKEVVTDGLILKDFYMRNKSKN